MANPAPRPVERCPIDAVLLVDRYERPAGYQAVAHSLPGHLLQLTLTGRTRHEANGRRYTLCPNDLIWYHEDETVVLAVDEPWTFLTLNFIAPALAPPPFEQRVRPVAARVRRGFVALLDAWRDADRGEQARHFDVHARLAAMLSMLHETTRDDSTAAQTFTTDPQARLWWELETALRRRLDRPIRLDDMVQITSRSPATIARSCHAAVGMAPLQRIKQIRLSLARGLVQRSPLSISQIARRIGYPRVHEFSRDYRGYYHLTPTKDRQAHA